MCLDGGKTLLSSRGRMGLSIIVSILATVVNNNVTKSKARFFELKAIDR